MEFDCIVPNICLPFYFDKAETRTALSGFG